MISLSEQVATVLLDGVNALLEDRIEDLIAKYPEAKLDRRRIETWFEFDPTRNKKYLPWIITQVATGNLKLPEQGERLRDNLMTFERLLAIPAYEGERNIQSIKTAKALNELIIKHGDIQSKSAKKKQKRLAGQTTIGKEGPLEAIAITDPQTLMNMSWQAYSAENPNWKRDPVLPTDVREGDLGDGLWCVRFPRFASSYLTEGPFIMVMKNGGPYIGIVPHRGEAQTLENEGISTAQAEQIYPIVKDAIPAGNLTRNMKVFDNMKFLQDDVKEGEKIQGPVNLAGTSLSSLPANLHITDDLNVSSTQLAQLPPGLRVDGTLSIQGTQIKDLPPDLRFEDMEWSGPHLNWERVKTLFYHHKLPDMKNTYLSHEVNQAKEPEELEAGWIEFKKELWTYFQTDPDMDKNIRFICREVSPTAKEE
ncbi:MAG: hypothetical protein ACYSUV_01975 [Planctomycetota bacterium]|jgi:hypothetical protein